MLSQIVNWFDSVWTEVHSPVLRGGSLVTRACILIGLTAAVIANFAIAYRLSDTSPRQRCVTEVTTKRIDVDSPSSYVLAVRFSNLSKEPLRLLRHDSDSGCNISLQTGANAEVVPPGASVEHRFKMWFDRNHLLPRTKESTVIPIRLTSIIEDLSGHQIATPTVETDVLFAHRFHASASSIHLPDRFREGNSPSIRNDINSHSLMLFPRPGIQIQSVDVADGVDGPIPLKVTHHTHPDGATEVTTSLREKWDPTMSDGFRSLLEVRTIESSPRAELAITRIPIVLDRKHN